VPRKAYVLPSATRASGSRPRIRRRSSRSSARSAGTTPQAGGHRAGPDARREVRGAARGADLGPEPGGHRLNVSHSRSRHVQRNERDRHWNPRDAGLARGRARVCRRRDSAWDGPHAARSRLERTSQLAELRA